MALLSVELGHWRALERTWLDHFSRSYDGSPAAVVTAGYHQSARLASLIQGTISGTLFLPGIPRLAEHLARGPLSRGASPPQSIALAHLAGFGAAAAPSAASFFEGLVDKGITPDMFQVSVLSLKEPGEQLMDTARGFQDYQSHRDRLFPWTPQGAVLKGPGEGVRYRRVCFYGFYDLNPGQRRYVEMLCGLTEVHWFSPVHPSHHWRKAFSRTLDFLMRLSGGDGIRRVDAGIPLSAMAQFGENLLTGKAVQKTLGIRLTRCGSGSAFTAAVAGEIAELGLPEGEIAVIASGPDGDRIREDLHCRGIPCSDDLRAEAGELPRGRFVLRLLQLPDSRFHHTAVENLLAMGQITSPGTPDPWEYSRRAAGEGARFGEDSMTATGFPFTGAIAGFFRSIPEKAAPEAYHRMLMETLTGLCGPHLWEELLPPGLFLLGKGAEVTFRVFCKMVEKALREPVTIAEGVPGGVSVLPMERVRGTVFRGVILTGLEEGRFPSRTVNDPRLTVPMKELLQMPSPKDRETEEAFLLRQVFEAAGDRLVILARNADEKGNSLALSPFLGALARSGAVEHRTVSAMPVLTLDIPEDPPFLSSSLAAQRERLLFDPEDPSPEAVHCGMIGPGFLDPEPVSATLLESYLRDPARFLAERVWRVQTADPFPVRSEPDPLSRGNIIHAAVERALVSADGVRDIVMGLAEGAGLVKLLGSAELADIWTDHAVSGIEKLIAEVSGRNWRIHLTEESLTGTVAGYSARGRVDLVFSNAQGDLVLADLKTGRPRGCTASSMLKKNLLQLPFYYFLARENRWQQVSSACYIHLEGSGDLTIEEVSSDEILALEPEFRELVTDTVEKIRAGVFPGKEKGV